MKSMKKIIAALLVLTMVLALSGTAMAASIKVGDYVKFTKNGYAYDAPKSYKKTSGPEVIVRKGSTALVVATKGDYACLQVTPDTTVVFGVEPTYYWFKTDVLKVATKLVDQIIAVVFSNGGNGKSKPVFVTEDAGVDQITPSYKKHVKATAKVWMHRTPSLSNSYGKALHKDDVVKYRRVYGADTRGMIFWGIRYNGKNLFVSGAYSKVVK